MSGPTVVRLLLLFDYLTIQTLSVNVQLKEYHAKHCLHTNYITNPDLIIPHFHFGHLYRIAEGLLGFYITLLVHRPGLLQVHVVYCLPRIECRSSFKM